MQESGLKYAETLCQRQEVLDDDHERGEGIARVIVTRGSMSRSNTNAQKENILTQSQ